MSELISPGDYFDRVNRAVEAVTSGKLSVAEASRTFNVLKATVQYKVQQQSKLSSTPIVSPSNPATEDVKTSRSVPMRSKAIGKRPATNNLTTNETPKTKLKKMIKTQTPEEEQNDSEEKPIESNVFISVDKKPNRITTRTSNRQIKAEVVEQTSAPVTNGSDKPLTEAQLQSPVQPNNFPMLSSKKIPRKSGAKPPVVEKDNNDNQQDFDKNVPGDNFSVKISAETVVASLATLDVGNDSETKDDQNLHGGPQIKLPKTGKDPTSMLNDYLQRQSTLSSLSALTGAPRLKSPVKVTPARTAKSDQKKFHSGVEVQLKVTVDQLCAKCSRIQKENIVQCLMDAAAQKADMNKLLRLARVHNAPFAHVKNCWAQLHPMEEEQKSDDQSSNDINNVTILPENATTVKLEKIEEPVILSSTQVVQSEQPKEQHETKPSVKLERVERQNGQQELKTKMAANQPSHHDLNGDREVEGKTLLNAKATFAEVRTVARQQAIGVSPLSGLMSLVKETTADSQPLSRQFVKSKAIKSSTPFVKWFQEERRKLTKPGILLNGLQRNLMIQQLKEKWENLPEAEKAKWEEKAKPPAPREWRDTANKKINDGYGRQFDSLNGSPQPSTSSTNILRKTDEIFASLDCVERKKRWALDPTLHNNSSRRCSSPEREFATDAMDVAGEFRILGQSMASLADSLLSQQDQSCSTDSALDLLLDSFWCSLGPLTALTQYIPEMNGSQEEDIYDLIDNSACLMPL